MSRQRMYPSTLAVIRDALAPNVITDVTLLGANSCEIGLMSSPAEETEGTITVGCL